MEKLPKKWRVKVMGKAIVDWARENLNGAIHQYNPSVDYNRYLCVDTNIKHLPSSYSFIHSADLRVLDQYTEITLHQFWDLVSTVNESLIDAWHKVVIEGRVDMYIPTTEYIITSEDLLNLTDKPLVLSSARGNHYPKIDYPSLNAGYFGLDFSGEGFTISTNEGGFSTFKPAWYPLRVDECFKKQEEMKVTDVRQLEVGDVIRIDRRPIFWSKALCKISYEGSYPLTIEIKGLEWRDGQKSVRRHMAMTCGEYGWDLSEIVKGGCTLISKANNMKDKRFPFKLEEKDAKKIVGVACSIWRPRLVEKWATGCLIDGHVTIEEDFYKEMRKACTPDQHLIFNCIFGEDTKESIYKEGDWVYCGEETGTWASVIKLTRDVKNNWAYAVTKQGNEQNFTARFITRKATQEEIYKAMCPYEDGELCFVKVSGDGEWHLRYATGRNSNNTGLPHFYLNQKRCGGSSTWSHHQSAKGIKLPKI